jgi:hypothetical protein
MKYIFFVLILLSQMDSFGQKLPSDSSILGKIFLNTDKGGKTYSCQYSGEETYSYQDILVYKIVFKTKVFLNNNSLILAIIEAPYGNQHGHQLGYRDLYFFKVVGEKIVLIDSIISDGLIPIGDESIFDIKDIGLNKKALISTFQSTGNQHFENTKIIDLLELNKLTYLFSISSEYDNSSWVITENENDSCRAERFEEVYEIVKTNTEWYNIKVNHKDFRYTNGCKEYYMTIDTNNEYMYFNKQYIEITNANNK